jgi:hypothetical protein
VTVLLDPQLLRRLDGFQLVLLHAAGETILPELCDVLGPERTLRFIAEFGGRTIQVPDIETLTRAAQDVCLYLDLRKGGLKPAAVAAVARRYGVSPAEALRRHEKVRTIIRGPR